MRVCLIDSCTMLLAYIQPQLALLQQELLVLGWSERWRLEVGLGTSTCPSAAHSVGFFIGFVAGTGHADIVHVSLDGVMRVVCTMLGWGNVFGVFYMLGCVSTCRPLKLVIRNSFPYEVPLRVSLRDPLSAFQLHVGWHVTLPSI